MGRFRNRLSFKKIAEGARKEWKKALQTDVSGALKALKEDISTGKALFLNLIPEGHKVTISGVWLVGSRAGGTARPDSDWDFVIGWKTIPDVDEGLKDEIGFQLQQDFRVNLMDEEWEESDGFAVYGSEAEVQSSMGDYPNYRLAFKKRANQDKRVIIMRGLPGSGKSTKARSYGGTIVSADDYFTSETGEYNFDPSKLRDAHGQCMSLFEEALARGDSPIVVDNTNTQVWEFQPYMDKAKAAGYTVEVDHVDPGLSDEELHERGTHGVPLDKYKMMRDRFEDFKGASLTKSAYTARDLKAVAKEQRGAAEEAMNRAIRALGGGMYAAALEYGGDIIHRAWEFADGEYAGSSDYAEDRLDKTLKHLKTRFLQEDLDRITDEHKPYLQAYVDAHRSLTPLNEAQRIANEIPIAIGEMRLDEAISLCEQMKAKIGPGWREWILEGAEEVKEANLTPETAQSIIQKIVAVADKYGFKVYAAGGYVRDLQMGKQPNDLDVIAEHPELGIKSGIELARKMKDDGVEGVTGFVAFENPGQAQTAVLHIDGEKIDFAAPRKEAYSETRTPIVVGGTLEEDVIRRDFTINSLLQDLKTGEVLDITGKGIEDIKNGVIRATGPDPDEIFKQDPLRLLRGVRLSARMGFDIDPETYEAMKRNAGELNAVVDGKGKYKVSRERVRDEINKLFLEVKDSPSKALNVMKDLGLMEAVHPKFKEMYGFEQQNPEHHDKDVWDHTLSVVDNMARIIREVADQKGWSGEERNNKIKAGMWAAFLHDVSKPESFQLVEGIGKFYGHDKVGAEAAESILEELKFANEEISEIVGLVRGHMKPHQYKKDWGDKAIRKLMREFGDRIDTAFALAEADTLGGAPKGQEQKHELRKDLRRRMTELEEAGQNVQEMEKPVLTGNDIMELGVPRGPQVGEIKKHLDEMKLENPSLTREQAVEEVQRLLKEGAGQVKQLKSPYLGSVYYVDEHGRTAKDHMSSVVSVLDEVVLDKVIPEITNDFGISGSDVRDLLKGIVWAIKDDDYSAGGAYNEISDGRPIITIQESDAVTPILRALRNKEKIDKGIPPWNFPGADKKWEQALNDLKDKLAKTLLHEFTHYLQFKKADEPFGRDDYKERYKELGFQSPGDAARAYHEDRRETVWEDRRIEQSSQIAEIRFLLNQGLSEEEVVDRYVPPGVTQKPLNFESVEDFKEYLRWLIDLAKDVPGDTVALDNKLAYEAIKTELPKGVQGYDNVYQLIWRRLTGIRPGIVSYHRVYDVHAKQFLDPNNTEDVSAEAQRIFQLCGELGSGKSTAGGSSVSLPPEEEASKRRELIELLRYLQEFQVWDHTNRKRWVNNSSDTLTDFSQEIDLLEGMESGALVTAHIKVAMELNKWILDPAGGTIPGQRVWHWVTKNSQASIVEEDDGYYWEVWKLDASGIAHPFKDGKMRSLEEAQIAAQNTAGVKVESQPAAHEQSYKRPEEILERTEEEPVKVPLMSEIDANRERDRLREEMEQYEPGSIKYEEARQKLEAFGSRIEILPTKCAQCQKVVAPVEMRSILVCPDCRQPLANKYAAEEWLGQTSHPEYQAPGEVSPQDWLDKTRQKSVDIQELFKQRDEEFWSQMDILRSQHASLEEMERTIDDFNAKWDAKIQEFWKGASLDVLAEPWKQSVIDFVGMAVQEKNGRYFVRFAGNVYEAKDLKSLVDKVAEVWKWKEAKKLLEFAFDCRASFKIGSLDRMAVDGFLKRAGVSNRFEMKRLLRGLNAD